ncbi:GlxA family transcriptional regulator [Bowmanella dokdonensis]|uniref:Helix-turn-helix domain-containing protein n=1 Tax=Bowmanella dokdonensis TaxID=751969 RepID=A0A939ITG5_9ALTE|nr:helix-turn-helix domain-containing protein [Bowmanella dokdonensis]MBN7827762.1 helix-turn-helix domain-containing protein [Bowmanella dokdonensis]
MKVTILLTGPLSLFELACATELFALPRPEFGQWYSTGLVSLSTNQFNGLCHTTLVCEQVEELPPTDLLVIPSYPVSQTEVESKLSEQILRHYQQGGRVISFCSGAFLLAELGLFQGRAATTHWRYAGQFKARFPHVQYQDDVLYLYDGRVGCSAGSAAAIDLGIEVIRRDYGYHYANTVARRLVLPAHRSGGQSQFVQKPLAVAKSSVSQVLDWAVKHLSSELTVDRLAQRANMTRRTFDRHFKKHYNMTPLEWLNERRLEVAKTLLETTSLSIDLIAQKAGFESPVTLRHNFNKTLSISPSRYRATFQSSQQQRA